MPLSIACLIAPRPLLVTAATEDVLFRPYAFRDLVHRARKLYRDYGAGERIDLVEALTPHGYSAKTRLATFSWFEKHLKGSAAPVADDITDRSERFMASEILREKLFRNLGEELPYGIAVEIEKFEQEGDLRRIHAAVIVDRAGHKSIVIGKGGERLKRISTDARKEMETLFGGKVWLETWVKVKSGWADDERALKSLGYD